MVYLEFDENYQKYAHEGLLFKEGREGLIVGTLR